MNQLELLKLARAYQQSALVLALAELDICSALPSEGATPEELAEKLGLELRPLAAMLAATAAMGLLDSKANRYFNTPLSADCLVKSGPHYIGQQLKSYADQYQGWANLPQAVREGRQVLPSLHNDTQNDPALRQLILSLHQGGQAVIPQVKPILDPYLAKARGLLDVGCGVGTYALAFAEAYPNLEVTLLDQSGVLQIAQEVTAANPARERVSFRSADYRTEELGQAEFELILFFQVLRTESPATIRLLLHKAAKALGKAGVVAIYDTFLEEGRTGPVENVFQNVTLSLMYSEGGLFTEGELTGWLAEAGFKSPQAYPITGVRPMVLYLAQLAEV